MRTGQEADFTTVSRQLTTTLYTEANLIPVPTPKKQGDLLVFPSKICVSMFFPLSTDPSGGRGSRRAESPQTTPTHTLGRARLPPSRKPPNHTDTPLGRARLPPSRSPLSVFSSRGSPTTVARAFLPGRTLPKTKPRSGARFPVDHPFRGLITTQQKGTVAWASARVITHETKRPPGATLSFCPARVCDSGLKGRFQSECGCVVMLGVPGAYARGSAETGPSGLWGAVAACA
ncbi:MAG: hypothetical protein RIT02_1331 [Planctomycetota bacterium]